MSGWRKRTIMEMAQTISHGWWLDDNKLEAFAAMVREEATAEANAKANASWTLMCEKMVAAEREACARLCEAEADDGTEGEWDTCCLSLARRIRERGQA